MLLVSESWATQTGNRDIPMLEDPSDYTILKLKISDGDLDAEDLDYLGEDENGDEMLG
jgi:hypothetical protein